MSPGSMRTPSVSLYFRSSISGEHMELFSWFSQLRGLLFLKSDHRELGPGTSPLSMLRIDGSGESESETEGQRKRVSDYTMFLTIIKKLEVIVRR